MIKLACKSYAIIIIAILLQGYFISRVVAQDVIDERIIFKAKLLTLMDKGIADSTIILNDLLEQKAFILDSPFDRFIFIIVNFNQRLYKDNSVGKALVPCDFKFIYDLKTLNFYFISGSERSDAYSFSEAIINDGEEYVKYYRERMKADSISYEELFLHFDCLFDYVDMSNRKRRKTKCRCGAVCSDLVDKTVYTY